MYQDQFYCKLNKVFSLMFENKLREDIDDTLLEKLLSIIKLEVSKEDFIKDLLKNTEVIHFCETVISSLLGENKKFSTPVIVFSIHLFGLICENPNIFENQKCLPAAVSFSNIAKTDIFFKCSPSVQNAILNFFVSIAKHFEGAIWLIEHRLIELALASFSSTSYYVKKTAGKFISSSLYLWSCPDFPPPVQKDTVDNAVEKIMLLLISSVQISKDTQIRSVANCCISTLREILENNVNVQSYNFQILQKIEEYFDSLSKSDEINQDIIDLLLIILHSNPSNTIPIKKVIQLLIKHRMFSTAFHLTASFLSAFEKYRPLTKNNISFLLLPLNVLSGIDAPNNEENIFQVSSNIICSSMVQEMKVKSSGVVLISTSLQALTKLTGFLSSEAITIVLFSLKSILQTAPFNDEYSYVSLENRIISLSILEFFASLLTDCVYKAMDFQCKQLLFEHLILFVRKPSMDCNIVTEALRLLKCIIALLEDLIVLDESARHEFVKLLCRKIFDSKEPIVDSSLYLACEMMVGKGYVVWKEFIFKEGVHLIIWNIAVEGRNDGVIKASALKILTEICLQPHFLQDIKSKKEVDEIDIMRILCSYVQDPDFFVQREAIQSMCKWMKHNEKLLSSCKKNMFAILASAVRSLDLDLKLIALEAWNWCTENSALYPPLSQPNLNLTLTAYCSSGFGSSLMYALDDYDEAAKYKAATILFELQTKLAQLGFTKDFIIPETIRNIDSSVSLDSVDFVITPTSKEEKNECIDNVMNMSTAEQLLNICKIVDLSDHSSYLKFPLSETECWTCSVSSFWDSLWSDKLIDVLKSENMPLTAFCDYSLSLLDDIIAAEKIEVNHSMNDTPDCY